MTTSKGGSTAGFDGPIQLEEAVATVLDLLGGPKLDSYLAGLPGRCSECGYDIVSQGHRPGPRYFWGMAPWQDADQDPAVGCSQWIPPKVAGVRPGHCEVCGEPLAGLGLTEKCRNRHGICRGCSVSFDRPGGLLLLNPGRRCRRARHNREGVAA
jgi:hypothetical protein